MLLLQLIASHALYSANEWEPAVTKLVAPQVFDVADDTVSIRSLDWDRDRFDIEFGLQEGTTYNSYLIFGDKTALVDASHEKFSDLYMKDLKAQLAERGRSLDYVIVSHTEPDHTGVLSVCACNKSCSSGGTAQLVQQVTLMFPSIVSTMLVPWFTRQTVLCLLPNKQSCYRLMLVRFLQQACWRRCDSPHH